MLADVESKAIMQRYAMIGAPDANGVWPLTPVYHLTRMLAHSVRSGGAVVDVTGELAAGAVLVTAVRGPGGGLSVIGMNGSKAKQELSIGGLTPWARFRSLVWNGSGDGLVHEAAPIETADACTARLTLPPTTLFVLTSLGP